MTIHIKSASYCSIFYLARRRISLKLKVINKGGENMFCPKCGKENLDDAKFCTQCGAPLSYTSSSQQQGHYSSALVAQPVTTREVLKKSRLVACLLCGFLGGLGVHRFYVGKIGTGILWLFTLGFLGIGTLIDFILIVAGSFTDKEGKKLLKWITEEA